MTAEPGGSLGGVQRKQLIDSRFAGTATETTAAAAGDKREQASECVHWKTKAPQNRGGFRFTCQSASEFATLYTEECFHCCSDFSAPEVRVRCSGSVRQAVIR